MERAGRSKAKHRFTGVSPWETSPTGTCENSYKNVEDPWAAKEDKEEHGGLTLREGKDAVVDVSSLGCLLHLFVAGQDPPITDVVGDGVIEEHSVLGHHPDVSTQ